MKRIFILAAMCWMPAAFAQEPIKPGEEHKQMAKAVGTWDMAAKMAMPDGKKMDCKGTATFKQTLGDLWICQDVDMDMGPLGKFSGKGMDTYCPIKKKYIGYWFDSMSTHAMATEGTYNKDTKTMTMVGEAPGHDGKMAKHTLTCVQKDADHFTFSMFVGDSKEAMMVIEYSRKK